VDLPWKFNYSLLVPNRTLSCHPLGQYQSSSDQLFWVLNIPSWGSLEKPIKSCVKKDGICLSHLVQHHTSKFHYKLHSFTDSTFKRSKCKVQTPTSKLLEFRVLYLQHKLEHYTSSEQLGCNHVSQWQSDHVSSSGQLVATDKLLSKGWACL
jgi:hypothetical protein